MANQEKREKQYIILTDEQGVDTKVELLFSIFEEKSNDQFIYVVDPKDDGAVIVFKSDKDGNLEMVTEENSSPEVMTFVRETFAAYQHGELEFVGDEEEEGEECSCGCGHHHHHHHHEGECCCGDDECECKGGDCDCKEDK
ncbi:MAG: hypothetical protein J6I69_00050 [Bacilli bacterium]|nr:hypothetical protein [Bacilli bacterium]